MSEATPETFRTWAIVELMGHRRLAGLLTEQEIAGEGFLRLDIPTDPPATQFYRPGAVYAITPVDEYTAREVAQLSKPEPVSRWELRSLTPPEPRRLADDDVEDEELLAE